MVNVSHLIKTVTSRDVSVTISRGQRDGSVVSALISDLLDPSSKQRVYVLDRVNIESLPHDLLDSDVEYFLLWFLKNGGAGKFYRAKKSLERWRGYRKATICGYTNGPRNGGRYRSYAPSYRALWWKPYSRDDGKTNRKKDAPFTLTDRGVERAENVWMRVASFLDMLVHDLETRDGS